jgi:hypothetical protein
MDGGEDLDENPAQIPRLKAGTAGSDGPVAALACRRNVLCYGCLIYRKMKILEKVTSTRSP